MIKESLVSLRLLAGAALLTAALLSGVPAGAQDGNTSIGAPQLRDFQLEPKQRIVTQPTQPATPVQQPAARPPATAATTPQPQAAQQRPAAAATRSVQAAPSQTQAPSQRTAAPAAAAASAPATDLAAAPAAAIPAPQPTPLPAPTVPVTGSSATLSEGPPLWVFFLAFVAVGLLGYGYWLRRQAVERRALALPAPIPAPAPREPAPPRPAPVPRPWLELELKPEKAHIDLQESVIEFELTIRNSGGSVASGIKLQARMFCSTPKQDEELSGYFKSKPGDHKTITVPDIPAGGELVINGSVDIKRDRMSALQVENKLLFVPLIGVNAFYGWGTARSGQTSRSFVIGREREADNENERMGAFRMDMGARVYRTIGQRTHKVSKRV